MAEQKEEKGTVVRTVDGYVFQSPGEAKRAIKEREYIKKLKKSMDVENLEELVKLYETLTGKGYFVTPVGIHFLKELQGYLKKQGIDLSKKPIPVLSKSTANGEDAGRVQRQNERLMTKSDKLASELERVRNIKNKLVIAVVALTVTVLGMIFIVMTSDNLGYYKAEDKVLNKYSAWEEQLRQKEQDLLEWESELAEQSRQRTTEGDLIDDDNTGGGR